MPRRTENALARFAAAHRRALPLLLVVILAASRPASAQAPDTEGVYRARPLAQIGLCQCIAERSSLAMRCAASAQECQNICVSTHYAFVPLVRDALKECPPQELYVVLPNADGHPGSGAITVFRGNNSTLLDSAYAAAELFAGQGASVAVGASDVKQVFGTAITARPPLPRHFLIFFPSNSDRMLPNSEADLRAAIADIKSRANYQVEIIGNTDTVASELANKSLSINRAEAVRHALVQAGANERAITVSGRADRDLLVQTGPGVPELRNRRVEITVR